MLHVNTRIVQYIDNVAEGFKGNNIFHLGLHASTRNVGFSKHKLNMLALDQHVKDKFIELYREWMIILRFKNVVANTSFSISFICR